ncbi:MAG: ferric reductase-like transmembrane domain-containing protein [Thermoplasmata archaeon]|nr:MAG: ferric reductase-like transmembrane domain-containing protein [Thermoplasmata archaeon]
MEKASDLSPRFITLKILHRSGNFLTRTFCLFIAIIFLLTGFSSTVFAEEEESCEDCHSLPIPDGDYILQDPYFWIDAPPRVSPNETFKFSLVITHYGIYEIKNFVAELDLSSAAGIEFGTGENAEKQITEIDSKAQTQRLIWNLRTGNTTMITTIYLYLNFTSEQIHTTVEDSDTYDYQIGLHHEIEIKELPFELSSWHLVAVLGEKQSFNVNIKANSDIYNLEVVPGRSVSNFTTVTPGSPGDIAKGSSKDVNITIQPDRKLEAGYIIIIWSTDEEGTEMDSLKIKITVKSKELEQVQGKERKRDRTWLLGRITGFIAFFLLVLLAFTGGAVTRVAKKLNKALGGAGRRVKFHCALSYQMLVVALLHAALLMYGHYSSQASETLFIFAKGVFDINIGTFTWIMMIIISIAGLFQKPIVRKIKHKNWRRLHLWLTIIALILIILHLLLAGTTLGEPLRTMIG